VRRKRRKTKKIKKKRQKRRIRKRNKYISVEYKAGVPLLRDAFFSGIFGI
jgi:hypothetical protein